MKWNHLFRLFSFCCNRSLTNNKNQIWGRPEHWHFISKKFQLIELRIRFNFPTTYWVTSQLRNYIRHLCHFIDRLLYDVDVKQSLLIRSWDLKFEISDRCTAAVINVNRTISTVQRKVFRVAQESIVSLFLEFINSIFQ